MKVDKFFLTPILPAVGLLVGAAVAVGGSMTPEQCVKSMSLLQKETASLNNQIKDCRQANGCQQVRVKLNRVVQRMSTLKRNCSSGMEPAPAAPAKGKTSGVPSASGGLSLAGSDTGMVAGLSSGDLVSAAGGPSFADPVAAAKVSADGNYNQACLQTLKIQCGCSWEGACSGGALACYEQGKEKCRISGGGCDQGYVFTIAGKCEPENSKEGRHLTKEEMDMAEKIFRNNITDYTKIILLMVI